MTFFKVFSRSPDFRTFSCQEKVRMSRNWKSPPSAKSIFVIVQMSFYKKLIFINNKKIILKQAAICRGERIAKPVVGIRLCIIYCKFICPMLDKPKLCMNERVGVVNVLWTISTDGQFIGLYLCS